MKKEFQENLIKKYPELFKVDEPSPYSQRGIECGDGWYKLINIAFGLIQNHCDNPDWVPERFAWVKELYNKTIWNMVLQPILYRCLSKEKYYKCQDYLCANVKYVKPNKVTQTRILQIKEKFGGLRIYTGKYSDEYIRGVMSMTESMSFEICEICGMNQQVRQNDDSKWIKTLCDRCRK